MRKTLEKRLTYLYSGELVSIILFIPVSYLLNRANPSLQLYSLYSFWVSFILLEFLLIQGTIYWYAKLIRLRNENNSTTPIGVVRLLHHMKVVNVFILIAGIFAFILDIVKYNSSLPVTGLVISMFIYIFAILEFINYFYVQLSYDNGKDMKNLIRRRKLKISSLRKDFKRIQKG